MTLNKIMVIASNAYDADGVIMACWDPCAQAPRKKPLHGFGDTLALFICREIAETYDPDASSSDQLAEAERVMERASDELARVTAALAEARRKLLRGNQHKLAA